MTQSIADFSPWLREAIEEAKATGLSAAAIELESRAFAAYSTSSEWFGETGAAIAAFQQRAKGHVSASIEAKLDACVKEINKVWPA